VGVLGGIAGGMVFGVVMSALSIQGRADQILVGIGINIFALGLTSFLNADLFGGQSAERVGTIGTLSIPVLSDLGGIGEALFDQRPGVYLALILLGAVAFAINRTDWGIALRAVGESPAAADAAGVSVEAIRWTATLFAAGMAGLAGAQLAIGDVGVFTNDMSAGRGFLALAAVLFGRWRPLGVLAACALFAFADSLQLRVQGLEFIPDSVWVVAGAVVLVAAVVRLWRRGGRPQVSVGALAIAVTAFAGFVVLAAASANVSIPPSLWLASPFVLALIALAAAGEGRTAMPSALALPYSRSET
jgi:general nucleoside transport system permease protein